MSDSLAEQMHAFARTNDVQGLRKVLENGGDPSWTVSASKNTALHISCASGSMQATRMLLNEGGADPDAANCNGDTPLMFSIMKGHLGISSLLLHRGASVIRQNASGLTPIACAASNGDEASLDMLLRQAAKEGEKGNLGASEWINLKDKHGRNVLHFACEGGSAACVQMLLDVGGDALHRNNGGETPLSIAKKGKNNEIVRILEERTSIGSLESEIDATLSTNGAPPVVAQGRKPTGRPEKKPAWRSDRSPMQKQNPTAREDESIRILKQKLLTAKLRGRSDPADRTLDGSAQGEWFTMTKQRARKVVNDGDVTEQHRNPPGTVPCRTSSKDALEANQGRKEESHVNWLEAAEALMEAEFPEAAALDIRPCHVLGIDVADLSLSQVDALQHIHQRAVQHLEEVKIELIRQQERMRYEEEVELKTMLQRYKE